MKRLFHPNQVLFIVQLCFLLFFMSLNAEASNDTLIKKTLVKAFTRGPIDNYNDSLRVIHTMFKYEYFTQFEGLEINSIAFMVIEPFEEDFSKSNFFETGKSIANNLHIKTKETFLRNNILFKEGDLVEPFLFVESERYLRQNSFIYDASIILENTEDNKVNALVFIQDVWSLQVNPDIGFFQEKGNLRLKDTNLGGLGGSFSITIKKNNEWKNNYKPDIEYKFSRLFNKHGIGHIYYNSDVDYTKYGFGINSSYIQEDLKLLGGFNVDVYKISKELIEPDSIHLTLDYHEKDLWAAYNISSETEGKKYNKYKHFILGSRIVQKLNHKDPSVDNHYYQDNVSVLVGLTYLNRAYYQDTYLFALGKTEDVPIGNKFELVLGREYQVSPARDYLGLSSTVANYIYNAGYLLSSTKFGFYLKDNNLDHGILDFDTIYFSPLMSLKPFMFRHFISARYSKAINPYSVDQLLDLKSNIRGFSSDSFKGDKRALLSLENNIILPINLFHFKSAFVSFADLALISDVGESIIEHNLKSSVGFGLRINNDRLVFPTIQLSFVYFPDNDYMGTDQYHFISEKTNFYQFDKMTYHKPHIFNW